ncbi:MAG TPA: AMP-binding protein, partial [Methanoregulaceae archaeon]|nr:AMP-binding protein [Methanoregulaceae archaeon]
MGENRHNMKDYDESYRDFKIEVPEYYNFGFDVVDEWARKDRNKLAMIWTDQKGNEKKFTFWDLMGLSNAAANILLKHGIHKGDRVMLMLHRVPEWWILTLALIKLGAVVSPGPTMLTSKDIRYRIELGQFKMVITDLETAPKVDAIYSECESLMSR